MKTKDRQLVYDIAYELGILEVKAQAGKHDGVKSACISAVKGELVLKEKIGPWKETHERRTSES